MQKPKFCKNHKPFSPQEIKLRRKAKASKGNLNGAEEMTLHKAT